MKKVIITTGLLTLMTVDLFAEATSIYYKIGYIAAVAIPIAALLVGVVLYAYRLYSKRKAKE